MASRSRSESGYKFGHGCRSGSRYRSGYGCRSGSKCRSGYRQILDGLEKSPNLTKPLQNE